MHRHLKESIDVSDKNTLTITDIRYIKNNLYRARSEQPFIHKEIRKIWPETLIKRCRFHLGQSW